MERRVLLAIFLAFLVLYVWQAMFVKPVPKPAPGPAASVTEAVPVPGASAEGGGAPAAAAPSTPATPKPPASAATPLIADTTERDVRIETRDVIAVFTNRGARLKSWRLKHYLDQQRQPQELIEQHVSTHPLPFTLRTSNEAVTATINDALYTTAGTPSPTVAESSPVDLKFEYRDSAGLHAVKEFHLDPSSYI